MTASLPGFLVDLNNAVVRIVSICSFGIVQNMPIAIGITVTLIYPSYYSPLERSKYLFLFCFLFCFLFWFFFFFFLLSLIFILLSAGVAKSTTRSCFCFFLPFFFFFFLIITLSLCLSGLD